jgi:hypothetical protein
LVNAQRSYDPFHNPDRYFSVNSRSLANVPLSVRQRQFNLALQQAALAERMIFDGVWIAQTGARILSSSACLGTDDRKQRQGDSESASRPIIRAARS